MSRRVPSPVAPPPSEEWKRMRLRMHLRPDTLIFLEGPDATGKSTQAERMAKIFPQDVVVHSPSGGGEIGQRIYAMTETLDMHPLTRRFLHLAAHVEVYERTVLTLLDDRGVFMDRDWWSSLAYSGMLRPSIRAALEDVVLWPTDGRFPDLVFLFGHEYQIDPHNTPEVRAEYERLAKLYRDITVFIPDAEPDDVTKFMLGVLDGRGFIDDPGYT